MENHSSDCSGDEVLYEKKTVNDRFLEDSNSSAYIEEVLKAQSSKYFSVQNLRD